MQASALFSFGFDKIAGLRGTDSNRLFSSTLYPPSVVLSIIAKDLLCSLRFVRCFSLTLLCYEIDHALEGEAIETSIVDGHERGNVRRRHLRETNSNSPKDSRAEGQRRLAKEVSDDAHARDPDAEDKSQDVRLLNKYLMASTAEKETFHERGIRRLSSEEVQMPSGRILADSTTIDVMVLYTEASMINSEEAGGTLMTTAQMESTISLSYAGVNDAFTDSGITASINVVHTAKVSKRLFSSAMLGVQPFTNFQMCQDELRDQHQTDHLSPNFLHAHSHIHTLHFSPKIFRIR